MIGYHNLPWTLVLLCDATQLLSETICERTVKISLVEMQLMARYIVKSMVLSLATARWTCIQS